jgi:hypothetical protein
VTNRWLSCAISCSCLAFRRTCTHSRPELAYLQPLAVGQRAASQELVPTSVEDLWRVTKGICAAYQMAKAQLDVDTHSGSSFYAWLRRLADSLEQLGGCRYSNEAQQHLPGTHERALDLLHAVVPPLRRHPLPYQMMAEA